MNAHARYATAAAVVLSLAVVVHNFFDPPDWVELHLEQIPPDVEAIYMVARDGQEVAPLQWYFSKVFPSLGTAKEVGEVWYWTVTGDRRRGDVQWRSADSYGILAKRGAGEWVLWWIDPRNIDGPSPMRYLLGGGGKVTIRATGIETATAAPKSLMDQVGRNE